MGKEKSIDVIFYFMYLRKESSILTGGNMDYTTGVSEDKSYVFITAGQQELTLFSALMSTKEVVKLAEPLQIKKLLIDLRKYKSKTSNLDKYKFAYQGAEDAGLNRDWKLAILKSPEDSEPHSIETLMREANYNCKLFTKENAAINWLKD